MNLCFKSVDGAFQFGIVLCFAFIDIVMKLPMRKCGTLRKILEVALIAVLTCATQIRNALYTNDERALQ